MSTMTAHPNLVSINSIARTATECKTARVRKAGYRDVYRTVLRCYRRDLDTVTLVDQPAIVTAVNDLVLRGVQVKVYERSVIYTVALAEDGTPVWTARLTSRKRDYVVVEIGL